MTLLERAVDFPLGVAVWALGALLYAWEAVPNELKWGKLRREATALDLTNLWLGSSLVRVYDEDLGHGIVRAPEGQTDEEARPALLLFRRLVPLCGLFHASMALIACLGWLVPVLFRWFLDLLRPPPPPPPWAPRVIRVEKAQRSDTGPVPGSGDADGSS
jgi:hypothetical protein